MPIRKSNEFTYLFRSVPNLTILRFPSNNHHAKIYTLSINYSKNSSLLRGNGWGKNGSIEICPVVAARNNIVTTQDTPRSRRVAHQCIVTESASLHPCSLRVPPYIYTSLASIVTLQPRWICRSVPPPFFLSSFFELISFQNRPCAFSRPLLIIRNFFSKNLKISSSAVFDTIVRKMSHIPVGEKLVEKL